MDEVGREALENLLARFGLELTPVAAESTIPGSYWGGSEAGLVGNRLFARGDTPVHSVLHETAHFVCMSSARRARLERDAGGDDAEENAVCCLQVLLAEHVPGVERERLFRDMDAWGYSFRLGSAKRWFEVDASSDDDALDWLRRHGVVDVEGRVSFCVREEIR